MGQEWYGHIGEGRRTTRTPSPPLASRLSRALRGSTSAPPLPRSPGGAAVRRRDQELPACGRRPPVRLHGPRDQHTERPLIQPVQEVRDNMTWRAVGRFRYLRRQPTSRSPVLPRGAQPRSATGTTSARVHRTPGCYRRALQKPGPHTAARAWEGPWQPQPRRAPPGSRPAGGGAGRRPRPSAPRRGSAHGRDVRAGGVSRRIRLG